VTPKDSSHIGRNLGQCSYFINT